MTLKTKRIYDPPAKADGRRILIDALWPRGFTKQRARIDFWARAIAPSTKLRQWYRHDPRKWDEFRKRYFAELDANPEGLKQLKASLATTTTLLFSSRETRLNNAAALKQYLER